MQLLTTRTEKRGSFVSAFIISDMSSNTEMPSFAAKALLEAIKDDSWLPLCAKLHEGIRGQIADMKISKRFCELSEKEQVALVEKNWKDLQQMEDTSLLDSFSARMGREVDQELLKIMLAKSNKKTPSNPLSVGKLFNVTDPGASDPTNVDILVQEISASVIDMMESGPANLMNSTKLFINRPLPQSIRSYVWSRSLLMSNVSALTQNANFGRLAPSLDLILSRRCHALLDNKFPRLSSRSNAAYAKTIASNYMRMIGVKLPTNGYDSFADMDHCLYLVVPLIVLLRSDFGRKKDSSVTSERSLDEDGNEAPDVEFTDDTLNPNRVFKSTQRYVVETSLYVLMEPRHLGSLRVSNGTMSLVERAPGLGRAITLLSTKNSELYLKLASLKAPVKTTRNADDDFTSEMTTMENFYNEQLIRGLSGLLNLETCMFVWDQGFIKDFGGILPLVLVALVLGNADELRGLTSFSSVIETFTSYCRKVTIFELQGLLSTHFPKELTDFFDITGNFRFRRGDDGVLQAVYRRLGETNP